MERTSGRSEHVLGPDQVLTPQVDPLLGAVSDEDFQQELEGAGFGANLRAPGQVQVEDTFVVSLSAEPEEATCPVPTGGGPCTPCTPVAVRSPVESLCKELRHALTPILAGLPSREAAAAKK